MTIMTTIREASEEGAEKLVLVSKFRQDLMALRSWAERHGLTELEDTLGPPIGAVERIITNALDPAFEVGR